MYASAPTTKESKVTVNVDVVFSVKVHEFITVVPTTEFNEGQVTCIVRVSLGTPFNVICPELSGKIKKDGKLVIKY
jgi:hypothetical protein